MPLVITHYSKNGGLFAATPTAVNEPEHLAGYDELDREEKTYLRMGLEAFSEETVTWYMALSILNECLRGAGDPALFLPDNPTHDDERAYQARLRLANVAAGTSKMALEATLVGRYGQAHALLRHIFETWRVIVYLGLRPDMARAWLVVVGDRPIKKPGEGTIKRELSNWARTHKDKELASQIAAFEHFKDRLDAGAHPTRLTVQQTFHPTDDSRAYLASGFDRIQGLDAFITGLIVNIFLLDRVIPLTRLHVAPSELIEPVRQRYLELLEKRRREFPQAPGR